MKNKFKKPLHIIIDGADGTGKSTIVQLLSRYYDLPIIKMPVPQERVRTDAIEDLSEMFNKTLVQFHESDFIMDRGFTSSQVYSAVFNRKHDLNYINNIKQILNPVIIIISAWEEGVNKTFRDDDIYLPNEIDNVDLEFLSLAKREGYPVIFVRGKTIIDVVNEAITIVDERTNKLDYEW